jgi:hypothetical protein
LLRSKLRKGQSEFTYMLNTVGLKKAQSLEERHLTGESASLYHKLLIAPEAG